MKNPSISFSLKNGSTASWLLLAVAFAIISGMLAYAWTVLNTAEYDDALTATPAVQVKGWTDLKLNKEYQGPGEPLSIQERVSGKENPFR